MGPEARLDRWEQDGEGRVAVKPLVAFESFVAHGLLCAVKLHYLEDSHQLFDSDSSSLQLILSPGLARALGCALLRTADEAETGPRGERGN